MGAIRPYPAAPRPTVSLLAAGAGLAAAVVAGVLLFARLGAGYELLAAALGLLLALLILRLGARALGFGGCVIALMVGCALLLPRRITMPLTPRVWGEAWDFTILLSGLWFALLALPLLHDRRRLRATGLELWFAALFVVAVLSLVININRFSDLDPAARGMVWLFAPMAALPLVANLALTRRQRGHVLTILIALAALLLLLGVLTTFRWWWTRLGAVGGVVFSPIQSAMGRTRSPLGGPGTIGLALAVLTPLVLVRMLGNRSLVKQLLYGATALLFLAGVVFSISRSAVAVALLGLIFFAVINCRALGRRIVLTITMLALAGLVIAGVVHAYRNRINFGRLVWLATRQQSQTASDRLRTSSVEAAVRIAQRHPVIGSGMGRWYPRDRSIAPIRIHGAVSAREPHSLYLIALTELGAIGLLIVLVLAAKPVRDFLRAYRKARDPEARALLSAFATGAFMIALYGITSSSIAIGYRLAFFIWAFLGLGYQLVFETQEQPRARHEQDLP